VKGHPFSGEEHEEQGRKNHHGGIEHVEVRSNDALAGLVHYLRAIQVGQAESPTRQKSDYENKEVDRDLVLGQVDDVDVGNKRCSLTDSHQRNSTHGISKS